MLDRSRQAVKYWAGGAGYSSVRVGYLQIITPAVAIATVYFAAVGGWMLAAIAGVCTAIGVRGLVRERRLPSRR